MIPTASKAKLPKAYSYSLGAKMVSDALAGVPQQHLLEIEFLFYSMSEGVLKRWAELLHRDGKPFQLPIVGVSYSGPKRAISRNMAEKGYGDPRWNIQVHAVPRHFKHLINGKATAVALPKIRGWLIENSHVLDREGHYSLTFYFDDLTEDIVWKEQSTLAWRTARR